MTIKKNDFIEIDYTGKLADGTIFDTTEEKTAHDNHLHDEKKKFGPATVCVGQRQLLPGLDEALEGKEIGKAYEIILPAEQAFGKRDIKKMRIVPSSTFKEHKVQPRPGLQIDVDGEMGTITRVSGGRIIVNFNHPLAGREVTYSFTIRKKITDSKQQVISFLHATLRMPKDKISVEITEKKATINLSMQLPPQFTDLLGKKLTELTELDEVIFAEPKKVSA